MALFTPTQEKQSPNEPQNSTTPPIEHSNIFPNTKWEMIEAYLVLVLQVLEWITLLVFFKL